VSEDAQLFELHSKLWGRKDLFDQIFRAVDLTADDFVQLQGDLHDLHPSRNHMSYQSRDVLTAKIGLLRSKPSRPLTITGSLVPKVVLALDPTVAEAVNVDVNIENDEEEEDCEDDYLDAKDGDDSSDKHHEDESEDDESERDEEDDKAYIHNDNDVLSTGSSAIFPCTIRYMDLTCLHLEHFLCVSKVLLIRDEWDAVVDIFNDREVGLKGSAVLTGQPGSGTPLHCS
jgi:hypothetical protein